MRKFFLLAAMICCLITAATSPSAAADPELVIKVGHVVSTNTPPDKMGHEFDRLLREKSGGKIAAEVYANSQLGGNREMCESLQLGTLEVCLPSTAFISGFTKATTIFDLPYFLPSNKAAEAVLDGAVGDYVNAELLKQGFVCLGWGVQGWRHVTANREVHHPSDMKGLKLRVMENPLHITHFNSLGASAIPMAYSEVFTALQQGAIDAQENPWCNIDLSRFFEVQPFIIKTAHLYDPIPFLFSEVLWNQYTPEQQKIIAEAAKEAIAFERAYCYQDEINTENKIAALGKNTIITITPEQREEFRKAASPVYEQFKKELPDGEKLIKMAEEIIAKTK